MFIESQGDIIKILCLVASGYVFQPKRANEKAKKTGLQSAKPLEGMFHLFPISNFSDTLKPLQVDTDTRRIACTYIRKFHEYLTHSFS